MTDKIFTCLWFEDKIEEAVKFYVSLLPNSHIGDITHYTKIGPLPEGTVLTMSFTLGGRDFMALNGGPHAKFNDAHSMVVLCDDQTEIDRLWDALTKNGGQEVQCGWLKDKYGLSWQITPKQIQKMLTSNDKEAVNRMMSALMPMIKLDIAKLEAAFNGK